jgi:hypothetical protein
MAVRLSALRTSHTSLPGKIILDYFTFTFTSSRERNAYHTVTCLVCAHKSESCFFFRRFDGVRRDCSINLDCAVKKEAWRLVDCEFGGIPFELSNCD